MYPLITGINSDNTGVHLLNRAPGLVDRVFALYAGSWGFDSHRQHSSEQFFQSSKPRYLHPVCSELENSGIRVAGSTLTNRQNCTCACKHTTNMKRTEARHLVCVAMIPYCWATQRTLLLELDYIHTHSFTLQTTCSCTYNHCISGAWMHFQKKKICQFHFWTGSKFFLKSEEQILS